MGKLSADSFSDTKRFSRVAMINGAPIWKP
jgi:hypothetical protein